MTKHDNKDKPQKLTLSGKLSLNKPLLDKGMKTKTFVSAGSNTIVEVKKSRLTLTKPQVNSQEMSNESMDAIFDKRLDILKRANEEKNTDANFTGLTKLAEMNQTLNVKNELEIDVDIKNNIASDNSLQQPIINQQTTREEISIEEPDNKGFNKKLHDNKAPTTKPKIEDAKKLNKAKILHLLDEDEIMSPSKERSHASRRRAREKARRQSGQIQAKVYREVILPERITVSEFANRMSETLSNVEKKLKEFGIAAGGSQIIDTDTAELIATGFGHKVRRIYESDVENILIAETDNENDLQTRAPIVTVMGHVDHGKTSLLDALKSTDIAGVEIGGITQHIGAYKVKLEDGKTITFIDTPGHEAFTAMRTRGANVTDIVILVVAADDGIKPQTIEAINHAKAAGVPIIVAVNKIDKPDINIVKVENELLSHGLISEKLGGDTIIVHISATKRMNIDKLQDAILLLAEMQELKANYNTTASGVVIESKLDKGQGAIATVLVKRGHLKIGDLVIAGTSYGRVRKMQDDKANEVKEAYPVDPVEIYGLNEAPKAGDKFDVMQSEKKARDIIEYRNRLIRERKNPDIDIVDIDALFNKASGINNNKELALIIKTDVQGSLEAIESSLLKIPAKDIKLKIIHSAVGAISESDLTLAVASKAIIIGFNVRLNNSAASSPEKNKVDIRYYSIIYNLIDEIREVMSGMLSPIIREERIGSVRIEQIFNITKAGKIAGSRVTDGIIKRGASARLLRDGVVVHEGILKTLKRFKEDVKEVREGFECGIAFENYEDMKEGDIAEIFELIEEKQKL